MSTHIAKCYLCDSLEVVNQSCAKCHKPYCVLEASKIDPQYCDECLRDVVIEETTYTKTLEDYDEDTDITSTSTSSCRQIKFGGLDYLFAAKRISTLQDIELQPILEYHRAFVYQLESEILTRQVKKQQETARQYSIDKHMRTLRVSTKTTVKKTKTVKAVSLEDLADMAIRLGITDIGAFLASKLKQ